METVLTLERLQADLTGLLDRERDYLRASEQQTIETLRKDLREYEQYLRAKHKLTRAVETIDPRLESAAEAIDATLSEGQLVTADQEAELMASLDDISQSLRTVRQQLRTESLSESDLRRLDTMVETETSLRAQVRDHNPTVVQSRVATLIADIEPVVDRVNTTLEEPRRARAPLPTDRDKLVSTIAESQSRLAEFGDTRAPEYLTDAQTEQVATFESELRAAETFIEAKSGFDEMYERLETELQECTATVDATLDMNHSLTSADRGRCLDAIETVRSSLEETSPWLELLAEADETAYAELDATLDGLEERVHGYNERFLDQELDRFDDAFTQLGDEAVTLIPSIPATDSRAQPGFLAGQ